MQASNKWLLLADPEAGTLVSRTPRVVLVPMVFSRSKHCSRHSSQRKALMLLHVCIGYRMLQTGASIFTLLTVDM